MIAIVRDTYDASREPRGKHVRTSPISIFRSDSRSLDQHARYHTNDMCYSRSRRADHIFVQDRPVLVTYGFCFQGAILSPKSLRTGPAISTFAIRSSPSSTPSARLGPSSNQNVRRLQRLVRAVSRRLREPDETLSDARVLSVYNPPPRGRTGWRTWIHATPGCSSIN